MKMRSSVRPAICMAMLAWMLPADLLADEWATSRDPVIKKGEGRGALNILHPCVLQDNGLLRMWFTGYWGQQDIVLAESSDGIAWRSYASLAAVMKHGGNEAVLATPYVLREDGSYTMWYTFSRNWEDGWSIGYAKSIDGIRWERFVLNPVLTPSGEQSSIVNLCVQRRGKEYHLWYQARLKGHWKQQIYYATSSNGLEWQQTGLITLGREFPGLLMDPWVLQEGKTWRLFFVHKSGDEDCVLYAATSPDGQHFTMDGSVPSMSHVGRPAVLKTPSGLRMWYHWDGAIYQAQLSR